MYKQCRTEQSAARQRSLTEGLLEAMSQQHYDEITVSDLCERMQIPRKSFYRYFSGKEGALHALIDYALMDFETFSERKAGTSGSAQEELERLFAYWLHRRKLLDALEKSGLSGALVHRAMSLPVCGSFLNRRFLSVEEQQARAYITLFVVSGFLSMVIKWHHDGYPQTVEQMAAVALRLVEQPLSPSLFTI